MGGGISVTSEVGHGSCFTIRVLARMTEQTSTYDDLIDMPALPAHAVAI
jgi:hypothetical protein